MEYHAQDAGVLNPGTLGGGYRDAGQGQVDDHYSQPDGQQFVGLPLLEDRQEYQQQPDGQHDQVLPANVVEP